MENTAVLPKQIKRGPEKTDWKATHLMLPPYLLEFARSYDEGMGALVRRLLKEEYDRQQAQARGA